ncbi:DNA polymerase III subunit gamma/tau [bacterium]|nr:DNA polymerase III subunit gamma/tau [bacterium]
MFARKYRPQDFSQMVGQEQVRTILSNALEQGKISHAYLFYGPRGTGKTSTARILAKCLNCEEGVSPTPCHKCSNCVEITYGNSLDTIEIDGASNRGIDEIRDLRERVKFAPAKSRYKVYIIDEVHMLTEAAFNALLKTLEEPPEHVVFIFATTEHVKVPLTITSRTQSLEFKNIPASLIREKLKEIAREEGIKIEEAGLSLLVQAGQGSIRDCETLLDQVATYSGREMTSLKDVQEVLGLVNQAVLFSFTDAIEGSDTKKTLELLDKCLGSGIGPGRLSYDLMSHFRNLLMAKVGQDSIIDLVEDDKVKVKDQAKKFTEEEILRAVELLKVLSQEMRGSIDQRLALEIGIIKLSRLKKEITLDRILSKIKLLETKIPEQELIHEPIRETFIPSQESLIPPKEDPIEKEPTSSSLWPKILVRVKQKKPSLGPSLEIGKVVKIEDGLVFLDFMEKDSFAKDLCLKNRGIIEEISEEVAGRRLRLKISNNNSKEKEVVLKRPEIRSLSPEEILSLEPMVKKAVEIFEGRIVKINHTWCKRKKESS